MEGESDPPKWPSPPKNLEDLPNRLKDLKKFAENEDEDVQKKRRRYQAMPRIFNALVFAGFVVVGAVFHTNCVGNKATLFLMIGGAVQILGSLLKVYVWLSSRHNGKIDAVANFVDFAFFVIAIWGSVEVFGAYATWESKDETSDLYCHPAPFYTAFVSLIGFWICLPLCCVLCCCIATTACFCACCFLPCCTKGSQVENVEYIA